MTLETEINLYCPICKKHTTQLLDPADKLQCATCGSALQYTGFQVIEM